MKILEENGKLGKKGEFIQIARWRKGPVESGDFKGNSELSEDSPKLDENLN